MAGVSFCRPLDGCESAAGFSYCRGLGVTLSEIGDDWPRRHALCLPEACGPGDVLFFLRGLGLASPSLSGASPVLSCESEVAELVGRRLGASRAAVADVGRAEGVCGALPQDILQTGRARIDRREHSARGSHRVDRVRADSSIQAAVLAFGRLSFAKTVGYGCGGAGVSTMLAGCRDVCLPSRPLLLSLSPTRAGGLSCCLGRTSAIHVPRSRRVFARRLNLWIPLIPAAPPPP